MKTRTLLATILTLGTSAFAAHAAATAEEAARIKAALETYVGSTEGVVSVEPDGDDYAITFDLAPYLSLVTAEGFSAKFDPIELTATPGDDGKWDVSSSGPYSLSYGIANVMKAEVAIKELEWSGEFDEALYGFASTTYTMSGLTMKQSVEDSTTKSKSNVDYAVASVSGESESTATGDGVADMTATMKMTGLVSSTKMEAPADGSAAAMPMLDYTVNSASLDYTTEVKGMRSKGWLDLAAWFVAHPSKDLIIKDQAALKEKITAALPLWDSLDGSYTLDQTTVGTMMGEFKLAKAGVGATMNGLVKDGRLGETFSVEGLAIPPGIAPPWSVDLVPTGFMLGFDVSGVDLETPAHEIVSKMDLATPDVLPPASQAALLPMLLPNNTIALAIPPGQITAPAYTVSYEGSMNISIAGGMPTGSLTVKMTGMDEVLAKVQAAAATDPNAQQAMGGLVAAKGFGKAEADGSLVWVINMEAPGKLTINGIDMSAMTGMAPAQ
jgi:hypothetical protein